MERLVLLGAAPRFVRAFAWFKLASLVQKQESEGASTACCVTAVWAGGSGLPVSLEQRDGFCKLSI